MKKMNIFFTILIAVEIIATITTYFIPGDISVEPSLFNPLGVTESGQYYLMIYKYGAPSSPFYVAADILILTVVTYSIYLLITKFTKKK